MLFDFCLLKKGRPFPSKDLLGFVYELNEDWTLFTSKKINIHQTLGRNYILIGDLINEEKWNPDKPDLLALKGNFYGIVWSGCKIHLYNSLFSVFPIYYCEGRYAISNSIKCLQAIDKDILSTDKTFILENILFNYGFFNRTLFKSIKLLDCNSFFEIQKDSVEILKHTEITDFYADKIVSARKSKDYLADLFIETTNCYFPENKFNITFTSGFDGRTLVAVAKKSAKPFRTSSFGVRGNDDVEIPMQNAKELNIPYDFYSLHEPSYIQKNYREHANKLNSLNPGGNGYLYPHFSYLAEQVAQNSDYLITGYFGSELFRALHIAGAVTSDVLVSLFKNPNVNIKELILKSSRLSVLNREEFETEIDELASDLRDYFDKLPAQLSQNQRFYIFVFEEILRKVFGAWIYAQSQYLIVRTPFLDFDFIRELLKTELAGVNNDFYTDNPLKRFKGQVLYAEIIKRSDSLIYRQVTGKGYKPSALLQPFGFIEIMYPFIKKRINRKVKKVFLDNLGIVSGFNLKLTTGNYQNMKLFNPGFYTHAAANFGPYISEKQRDLFLHCISFNETINE